MRPSVSATLAYAALSRDPLIYRPNSGGDGELVVTHSAYWACAYGTNPTGQKRAGLTVTYV